MTALEQVEALKKEHKDRIEFQKKVEQQKEYRRTQEIERKVREYLSDMDQSFLLEFAVGVQRPFGTKREAEGVDRLGYCFNVPKHNLIWLVVWDDKGVIKVDRFNSWYSDHCDGPQEAATLGEALSDAYYGDAQ